MLTAKLLCSTIQVDYQLMCTEFTYLSSELS